MLSDERLPDKVLASWANDGEGECYAAYCMARELLTLRAEVERMRGALTTISDMSCQCVCQKATSLALDALTPPTKE